MRKLVIIIISLILAFTVGCKQTPEIEIVINKGDGKTESAVYESQLQEGPENPSSASPTDADAFVDEQYSMDIPSTWTDTLSLKWLDVVFDNVEIEYSELDQIPVYELKRSTFLEMNNTLAALLSYFLPDATGMREIVMTKSDYEHKMQQLLRGYYDSEAGGYLQYDQEFQEEQLKILNERYSAAPDSIPYQTFDLSKLEIPFSYQFELADDKVAFVNAKERSISIKLGISNDEIIQRERWLWSGDALPNEKPLKKVAGILISQEAALAKSNQVMADLGLSDFSLVSIETARVVWESSITRKGYYIVYIRNPGGYIPFDYSTCSDFMLQVQEGTEQYAAPQDLECITMFIDETGVCYFQWNSPYEVQKELASKVRILGYEKIREIMLQTLRSCLAWNGEDPQEDPYETLVEDANKYIIRRVVLGSANIVPQNSANNIVWNIPVWFLEFSSDNNYNAGDPNTLLAFNAIDGTLLNLGY